MATKLSIFFIIFWSILGTPYRRLHKWSLMINIYMTNVRHATILSPTVCVLTISLMNAQLSTLTYPLAWSYRQSLIRGAAVKSCDIVARRHCMYALAASISKDVNTRDPNDSINWAQNMNQPWTTNWNTSKSHILNLLFNSSIKPILYLRVVGLFCILCYSNWNSKRE